LPKSTRLPALKTAKYERVFEAARNLFAREIEEIEELMAGWLE
jgi:hypothetical protein